MRHLFLTGGTGVLGTALIERLLRDPLTRVTALLRAADDADAAARRARWTADAGLSAEAAERLDVRRGDASAPLFGLARSDWESLAASCTGAVHAAGAVRLNRPLDEARRSAVDSLREVLRFARTGAAKAVDVVSTVGVGGRRPGPVPERSISEARDFHNTYERAKAEAEERLLGDEARGVAWTLHRPSMIVGEARTGRIARFQVFYHLCELLTGRRTGGWLPRTDFRLDVVPVDHVAAAIAWAHGRPDLRGAVLHHCAGPTESLPLVRLAETLRRFLADRGERTPRSKPVPLAWLRALAGALARFGPAAHRRALEALPPLLDYLGDAPAFENKETDRRLAAGGGPRRPAVDDYLGNVLRFYWEAGGLRGSVPAVPARRPPTG